MKIINITAACLLAVLALAGCLTINEFFRPGIYEGEGQGYRGNINVRVFVTEGGFIDNIEILDHCEDDFASYAMDELAELVMEMNTTEIDAVSGATVTSEGFLSALKAALHKF